MAEFEELDCACAGIVGEDKPEIGPESIDVRILVGVIRELHLKKILVDKECKTIRNSGARQYKCYFELAFALLAKPHETVKTAIRVLKRPKNPVIDKLQIPQFLNVCLGLHQLLNPEDVQEMKRRESLKLIERIIHVVCMKDFTAVKELADVLGMNGCSGEKDWLLVYVKWHEEGVLTDKDVQELKEMRTPFLQRIWELFSRKDPDALRKAGDIIRRSAHGDLTSLFPVLADLQESRYLSDKEYSSLFGNTYTPLPDLMKMVIAKDKDTSKNIAAVLQKHGYDDESKAVIVLAEFVEEECLSVEEGRDMIDVRSQLGREWISMWSHAAAAKTSQVSEQMAKILDAHGFAKEAAVVRKRETVGDPMPPTQPGSNSGRKRSPDQSASSPKRKQNTPPGSNSGRKRSPDQSSSSPKRKQNTPPECASGSTEDEEALRKLKIFFVVMTANDNEYTAALDYLKKSPKGDPSLKDVKKPKSVSHSNYKVFKVAGKQGILMQCADMGSFTRNGSNWHTFKLLNEAKKYNWPLKVIFIVGCCGAHATNGKPIEEGTIILAEVVQQYLIGKMEEGGVCYNFRPLQVEPGNEWIEFIEKCKQCESDQNYTIKAFEKIHMCSGDFVIKNDETAQELCGGKKKIGFEMEGLGVMCAIDVYKNFFRSKNEEIPDVVLVKGVSDNAGGDKNKPKNCLYFSSKVADADEDTRQRKCAEMSLTLVLRAMIKKWKN